MYLIEDNLTKDDCVRTFVNARNAELTLKIPDKVNDVIHYFRKVKNRLKQEEIAKFSSRNEICSDFKHVPNVGSSIITDYKPFGGSFLYVLPLPQKSKDHTLKQQFDMMRLLPLRLHNFLITDTK